MRPCVKCGECDEPIIYPLLTTYEGIYVEWPFWAVYNLGVCLGLFYDFDDAQRAYDYAHGHFKAHQGVQMFNKRSSG
jgi:hypothetical protein